MASGLQDCREFGLELSGGPYIIHIHTEYIYIYIYICICICIYIYIYMLYIHMFVRIHIRTWSTLYLEHVGASSPLPTKQNNRILFECSRAWVGFCNPKP